MISLWMPPANCATRVLNYLLIWMLSSACMLSPRNSYSREIITDSSQTFVQGLNQKDSFRFRVIALAENGGHHIAYSNVAKKWLTQLAADSNFSVDYINNTDSIDETF